MQYFYHNSIRNYTSVLGALLNEIKVQKDGRTIGVPLHYSGQDKFRAKHDEKDSTKGRVKLTLPRIGFKLTGFDRDPKRALNKMNKISENKTQEKKELGELQTQYQKVPYIFSYSVYVRTKTLDEMFQITEQVISKFDPTIHVNVDAGGLDKDVVAIKLESSDFEDAYEGSFEQDRDIEMVFNFTIEGWIYKRIRQSKIIKTIKLDFSTDKDFDPSDLGTITIDEDENVTITDE